jgi:hypothetical protein
MSPIEEMRKDMAAVACPAAVEDEGIWSTEDVLW